MNYFSPFHPIQPNRSMINYPSYSVCRIERIPMKMQVYNPDKHSPHENARYHISQTIKMQTFRILKKNVCYFFQRICSHGIIIMQCSTRRLWFR